MRGFRLPLRNEKCAVLGCYAGNTGNLFPTFRDSLSIKFLVSRIKQNMSPIACSDTSVKNYHYSLRNNQEDRSSQYPRSAESEFPVFARSILHTHVHIKRQTQRKWLTAVRQPQPASCTLLCWCRRYNKLTTLTALDTCGVFMWI